MTHPGGDSFLYNLEGQRFVVKSFLKSKMLRIILVASYLWQGLGIHGNVLLISLLIYLHNVLPIRTFYGFFSHCFNNILMT